MGNQVGPVIAIAIGIFLGYVVLTGRAGMLKALATGTQDTSGTAKAASDGASPNVSPQAIAAANASFTLPNLPVITSYIGGVRQ